MKETIFHPEARAEADESVKFYEARLNGLGLRFLTAIEATAERISTNPRQAHRSLADFASGSFRGFPTTSSIGPGRITSIWLPLPTTSVVRDIGATALTADNHSEEAPPLYLRRHNSFL
ncbi:MAG: hypothetical protein HYV01_10690 [Deltaproteobacteria bacterium]|nr:hypothetical protein [Deltaproteobacteria bacterium]